MTTQTARRFLLPLGLALAAMAAFNADLPIAHACRTWNNSAAMRSVLRCLGIFEPFGHGLGVLAIILTVHQLDRSRRWAIPRLVACTFAAGILADLLKLMIVRVRPYKFAFDGSVWTTFGDWLPILGTGSGGQSFPSGHTATATALAAALLWLYPNGRVLFPVLAVLVGCQRIASGAHYPSDVLLAAAVGCAIAQLFLYVGYPARWFDRWEAGWRSNRR